MSLSSFADIADNIKTTFGLAATIICVVLGILLTLVPKDDKNRVRVFYLLLIALFILAIYLVLFGRMIRLGALIHDERRCSVEGALIEMVGSLDGVADGDRVTHSDGAGHFFFRLPATNLGRTIGLKATAPGFEVADQSVVVQEGTDLKIALRHTTLPDSWFRILGDRNTENFTILIPAGQVLELAGSLIPYGQRGKSAVLIRATHRVQFETGRDDNGGFVRVHVDRDIPNLGQIYVVYEPIRPTLNVDQALQHIDAYNGDCSHK